MVDLTTPFTPLAATLGGVLIGLSAVMLLALNGRLAGISSLLSAAISPKSSRVPRLEATAFLIGLVLAPFVVAAVRSFPEQTIVANTATLIIAGICVGAGTAIGNGCTSGHGVCGIARLSARSLLATATFMFVGVITVFFIRHVI